MESAIAAPEAFGASFDVAPLSESLELGEGLEGDPALAFRRTLGMFATGVTVLTARVGEQVHGMTANAFMSVSLRPPLVLISIDRRAKMGALMHEGTRFGVSVLEARQTGLSDRFAGRVADDPPEATFELVHETPLVEGALAHLVARVVRSYWGGDHSLFLGQVEFARYGEGRPLLFHGGRYERLIEDPRVFSQLPRELLDPILALGEEREFGDGEAVMRIGEAGCDLLLVVEGSVRVERPGFHRRQLSGRHVPALVFEGAVVAILHAGEVEADDLMAVRHHINAVAFHSGRRTHPDARPVKVLVLGTFRHHELPEEPARHLGGDRPPATTGVECVSVPSSARQRMFSPDFTSKRSASPVSGEIILRVHASPHCGWSAARELMAMVRRRAKRRIMSEESAHSRHMEQGAMRGANPIVPPMSAGLTQAIFAPPVSNGGNRAFPPAPHAPSRHRTQHPAHFAPPCLFHRRGL